MTIRTEHEIHRRRLGRNVGVGLTLVAFIAVIFGLTVVKVGRGDYSLQQDGTEAAADSAPRTATQSTEASQ